MKSHFIQYNAIQYNINICNAHMVSWRAESEVRAVTREQLASCTYRLILLLLNCYNAIVGSSE